MSRNRILLYPLAIFFALFLLDKLALIPALQERGRPGPTPLENLVSSLQISHEEYVVRRNNGAETRPYALILGSSRSEFFQYLDPSEIRKNPHLTPSQKQNLLDLFFETRFAYKAADLFVPLVFLDRILKSPQKPDLVILEFSPEMLNRNSPSNIQKYIYENILDPSFLLEIYPYLEGEERGVVQNRILFSSYAYRFQPEKALANLINGKNPMQSGSFVQSLLIQRSPTTPIPDSYSDYPVDRIPDSVYKEKFLGYTRYLREEFVLRDFTEDPSEMRIFLHTLDRLKEAGVRTLVWVPKVHPLMEAEWKRIGFDSMMPDLKEQALSRGFPFYDGWHDSLTCLSFVDSSHLSARCAPPLMSRILDAVRQHYPDLP